MSRRVDSSRSPATGWPAVAAGADPVGHAAAPGSVAGVGEQLAEPAHLDVAAGQHHRDPLAVPDRDPSGQDRGEGRGAGRLEDLLEPLDREPQAGEDRRVVEQDDVVEVGGAAISSVSAPANGAPRPSATLSGWIRTTSPRAHGQRHAHSTARARRRRRACSGGGP